MSIVRKKLPTKKNTKQKESTRDQHGESANFATTDKGAGARNHQNLLKKVLLKLSDEGYFAWANNTGTIKTNDRFQRYGLVGSADILAIQPGTGRFCAFEIKTGVARQSKQQKLFEKAVLKRNGIYKVIRSLEDMHEFIIVR